MASDETVKVKMVKGANRAVIEVPRMHGFKAGPDQGLSTVYWFRATGGGDVQADVFPADAKILAAGGEAFGGRVFEVVKDAPAKAAAAGASSGHGRPEAPEQPAGPAMPSASGTGSTTGTMTTGGGASGSTAPAKN